MIHLLLKLAKSRKGATAIEYGLIVSLIVIAMVAALKGVANSTSGMWNHVSTEVSEASKPRN